MQNPITRHMARLQNPQIIVHNTSPDGSLRGAAMQEYNIPAITVEIGDPSRFQKRFVKSAILGVTNILSHLKMIEDDHEVQDYDPVVCAKSVSKRKKKGKNIEGNSPIVASLLVCGMSEEKKTVDR